MTKLLTVAQMRSAEQAAIAQGGVTGLDLMERAGHGVVAACLAHWPELADPGFISTRKMEGRRAVVVCGAGNNGGDGFVIARVLHEAGWRVDVFLFDGGGGVAPDARVNEARWRKTGAVHGLTAAALLRHPHADLYVDALFGIGLSRPLAGELIAVVDVLARQARVAAVDVPSGLCAQSGRALGGGPVVRAGLTVTFDSPKPGHFLADGPVLCGHLAVADIGIAAFRDQVLRADPAAGITLVNTLSPEIIDMCAKRAGHKYSYGHAVVMAGASGQGGAARLAARGALRIGAGAVTIGCPAGAMAENAAQVTAVMLREVPNAAALAAMLDDRRITALCLGPGLGMTAAQVELLAAALAADADVSLVLDADALSLLARDRGLFARLHDRCVLTPHDGEFARLFPDLAQQKAGSRVDAVRKAAQRAGCTVLLKGPDTVIADAGGQCFVHGAVYDRQAPWLATAGSGDVLAGFITGLLARGFAPMDAATTGVWLHTSCARECGPGLIAEDLSEALPKVLRALGI